MSASLRKRPTSMRCGERPFVPTTDSCGAIKNGPLFDHLVGELLERFRYFQPKRTGGFQVNHELELGRLHDRKVSWLRPIEDTADVNPHLTKHLDAVGRVGGQTASPDELGPFVNRRDAVARGKCDDLILPNLKE